jgi:mannose-1-phosphate guanylyltransferase
MHVMPADHLIETKNDFILALRNGEIYAGQGYLVTYGIKPDRPETGYGYVQASRPITSRKVKAYLGKNFTEKPNRRIAQRYLRSNKYFWNSGIFSFRITEIIDAFKKLLPDLYKNICLYADTNDVKFFRAVTDISIDYGIMERSKNFCIIPARFKWDDVGSWLALARYHKADSKDNIVQGDIKYLDTTSSIMYTSGVPLNVYGINNLVIVVAPTGVLVCDKKKAPDLKNLFNLSQQRRKR